jgi:AP-3 complex subunit mu
VTLEFTLTPRLSGHALEDVVVELYLGDSASALKFTVARSGGHFGSGGGGTAGGVEGASAQGSSWMFDPKRQVSSMAYWTDILL